MPAPAFLIALGKIMLTIGRWAGKGAKYFGKAVKLYVTKSPGTALSRTLQFIASNRTVLAGLVGATTAWISNDIIQSEMAKKGIKTSEVDAFLKYVNALQSDLQGRNEAELMSIEQGLSDVEKEAANATDPAQAFHNHPRFWDKTGKANQAIRFENESDALDNERLDNVRIRNVMVITNKDNVSEIPNADAFKFPDNIRSYIGEAADAYYARLSEGATLTDSRKESIIDAVETVIAESNHVVQKFHALLRYENAKRININGEDAYGCALVGEIKSFYYTPSNREIRLPGIYPSSAITSGSSTIWSYAANPNRYVAGSPQAPIREVSTTYYNSTISNKQWTDMVADIKKYVYCSEDAWMLNDYLFGGIFADKGGADCQEVWILHPMIGNYAGNAVWWDDNDGVNCRGDIYQQLRYLKQALAVDKAVIPILSYLGLGKTAQGSNPDSWYNKEYKRNFDNSYLRINDTDDSFYEALANATWRVAAYLPGAEMNFPPSTALAVRDFVVYPDNINRANTVYMRNSLPIKYGDSVYKDEPSFSFINSGEIASRIKFTDEFHLALLNTAVYHKGTSPSNSGFIYYAPGFGVAYQRDGNSHVVNGEGDAVNFAHTETKQLIEFIQEKYYMPSLFDGFVFDFADIPGNSSASTVLWQGIKRNQDPGYQECYVPDLDAIRTYMYSTLYTNLSMLKEAINRLKSIETKYALES